MDPELELLGRSYSRSALVQQSQRFKGHEKPVTHVLIGPDSDTLYSSGEDSIIRAWNAGSAKTVVKFEGHTSPVNGCALDGEQRLLFSASNDNSARAWDAARGKELLKFAGHEVKQTHAITAPHTHRAVTTPRHTPHGTHATPPPPPSSHTPRHRHARQQPHGVLAGRFRRTPSWASSSPAGFCTPPRMILPRVHGM